jgi:hypothetical protein
MVLKNGMTKEEFFYYKVKHDKPWYLETFLKIRDKKSQLIPFKLNTAQRIVSEIIKDCEKNGKLKRFIVLKARQMGLSTYFEGDIFHDTTTNSFKNSMIIAHEDKATQNLFSMSKLYYDELDDTIKPMKKYSNEKALVFENPTSDDKEKKTNPGLRSKITVATANTVEAGRSATIHNLHASEVAFFPDAKKTMTGLLQSVPDELNTMVVLESTANGVGDWFHDMWQKASRGENEFIPIFLPWFIDPGYTRPFRSDGERVQFLEEIKTVNVDSNGKEIRTYEYELMNKFDLTLEQLNWRRWAIANKCQGDDDLFMQEYPATAEEAFISSGRPKFNIKSLKKYQTLTKEGTRGYLNVNSEGKVELLEDNKGYVTIWQKPDPGRFYSIGADVAEGLVDGDYSCATVGDNDSFDVVAMWHGHIDPDLFGMELVKLAKYYNEAYLGVEGNNHGLTTLNSIKKLEYWNLYFSKNYDRVADTMTQKLGWYTTIRTKPLMIDKLAEFIREMHLGIYSDFMISEMITYIIEDNGKTNAQVGCHDDTVMSLAIMLQLLLEGRGEHYTPEIPIDERDRTTRDIVDPLFEKDNKLEISE